MGSLLKVFSEFFRNCSLKDVKSAQRQSLDFEVCDMGKFLHFGCGICGEHILVKRWSQGSDGCGNFFLKVWSSP